jgi:hypothetical protein
VDGPQTVLSRICRTTSGRSDKERVVS